MVGRTFSTFFRVLVFCASPFGFGAGVSPVARLVCPSDRAAWVWPTYLVSLLWPVRLPLVQQSAATKGKFPSAEAPAWPIAIGIEAAIKTLAVYRSKGSSSVSPSRDVPLQSLRSAPVGGERNPFQAFCSLRGGFFLTALPHPHPRSGVSPRLPQFVQSWQPPAATALWISR
jgi:hypothetical protein